MTPAEVSNRLIEMEGGLQNVCRENPAPRVR